MPIILHHHERYAGHGYPYGLRGNEIPLGARIVAIADAYDAMIHDRPYKRAISHDAGDRRAAAPRRDAVRPRARRRCSATCTRAVAPAPDPTILAMTASAMAHRRGPPVPPDAAPSSRADATSTGATTRAAGADGAAANRRRPTASTPPRATVSWPRAVASPDLAPLRAPRRRRRRYAVASGCARSRPITAVRRQRRLPRRRQPAQQPVAPASGVGEVRRPPMVPARRSRPVDRDGRRRGPPPGPATASFPPERRVGTGASGRPGRRYGP